MAGATPESVGTPEPAGISGPAGASDDGGTCCARTKGVEATSSIASNATRIVNFFFKGSPLWVFNKPTDCCTFVPRSHLLQKPPTRDYQGHPAQMICQLSHPSLPSVYNSV